MMDRKWIINARKKIDDQERKLIWEDTHASHDYENVWSMTDDEEFRNKIISEVTHTCHEKILIPGCGSRIALKTKLIESLPDIKEICCTDFQRVIETAAKKTNQPKIKYKARNSQKLGFRDEWDIVIVVNSILSESDEENRNIVSSCFNSLKPGGVFVGMFPTIFTALDIAYLKKDQERLSRIDLERSSLYEKRQGLWQIFYTPLRLRQVFLESYFELEKMEIFFCDSEYFMEHSEEYYGLSDPDIVVYEFLVVAKKPSA